MKQFLVSFVILVASELMIGGRERTYSFSSYKTGYLGLSAIIGTNFFIFWSF
jgi:hypothetical protein